MAKMMTFATAINEALETALRIDETVLCYGLGVPDPKGVFGTTIDLQKKYGSERVFDMPTAENGMTGVAIGVALGGMKPVMTHQRLDFFLLAMDQLVNNAAKWHFMFGGQMNVPITIRLIIGRGWGQGPTHAQSLQAWFAHIPGLKVVMPTTVKDAKGLLLESIFDPDPVVFLEHRWLHNQRGEVPDGDDFRVPLGKAEKIHEGDDITIVSTSYMTIEALHAVKLASEYSITCDVIDLKCIRPIDWVTIVDSVKKTGRLLVLDTASEYGSIASDIVSFMACNYLDLFKEKPRIVALPDVNSPTSYALTKSYYKDTLDILDVISAMYSVKIDTSKLMPREHHDVPGDWFKGPF